MCGRTGRISSSVARALGHVPNSASNEDNATIMQRVSGFFSIFSLNLSRYRTADFVTMRQEFWYIDEEEYATSFGQPRRHGSSSRNDDTDLIPVGDLGYSGSTFLITSNGKYLIKSLDRAFEYHFFKYELFEPYIAHMMSHPGSLLVRITDTLHVQGVTIGGLLGLAPTHHIVMENLMHGKESEQDETTKRAWETYDLKPDDYFFPERDIASGMLAPESVKKKLADKMPDGLDVSADMRRQLVDGLLEDTAFLASSNVVDYSLFVLRFPGPGDGPPAGRIGKQNWRSGVVSRDGRWTYRALLLDFFWAKHKLQPKALSGLVSAFNLVARKGPMTITADPSEYRTRFMDMAHKLFPGGEGMGERELGEGSR